MKYKLFKDLPMTKAGAIFQEMNSAVDGSKILREYDSNNKTTILVNEIKNFNEWFENIKNPKLGERYFYIDAYGYVESEIWSDDFDDNRLATLGVVYRTEEECEKALGLKLAEVRLRQTSDFEPDFENGKGGWIVYYDYGCETLAVCDFDYYNAGEPVRYATREEAEKSIKENEADWKKYFGIKED